MRHPLAYIWISEPVTSKGVRLPLGQPSLHLEWFLRSFFLKFLDCVEKMEIRVVTRGRMKWVLGKQSAQCKIVLY